MRAPTLDEDYINVPSPHQHKVAEASPLALQPLIPGYPPAAFQFILRNAHACIVLCSDPELSPLQVRCLRPPPVMLSAGLQCRAILLHRQGLCVLICVVTSVQLHLCMLHRIADMQSLVSALSLLCRMRRSAPMSPGLSCVSRESACAC